MNYIMRTPKMVNGEKWINGVNITWHDAAYAEVRAAALAAGFQETIGSFDYEADWVAERMMTQRQRINGHKCVAKLDAAVRLLATCPGVDAAAIDPRNRPV